MADKKFDNNNTVSLWEKEAKSGNTYLSGVVYVDNIPYTITLFHNETTSPTQPVLKGKIELRESK